MAFAISPPLAGVDFTKSYRDGHPQFTLGTEILASDGVTYKFVRFTANKSAYSPYIIGYDFTLGSVVSTSSISVAPLAAGVPQTDLAGPDSGVTYSYGWVAVKGPFQAWTANSTAGGIGVDTELYVSSFASGAFHSLVSGLKQFEAVKVAVAGTGTNLSSSLATVYATDYLRVQTDA